MVGLSFFDPNAYQNVTFEQDEGTLNVQLLTSESHEMMNTITENPVESGSNVTDHVQKNPRKYMISGFFSDAAVNIFDLNVFFNSRMSQAWAYMEALWESANPITIRTKFTTLENMILESLSVPRDKGTGNAFVFNATFKEIRVVDTEAVAAAVPQKVTPNVPQASANINQGKQAGQTPSSSSSSQAGSLLSRLLGVGL